MGRYKTKALEPPGLLAWQACLVAYACGLYALEGPAPAVAALAVLLLFVLPGRSTGRAVLAGRLLACAALGFGAAWLAMPAAPGDSPGFITAREKTVVSGRVEAVASKPECRLQMVLSGVHCRLEDGSDESLPGRVAWTWDRPPLRPEPGQDVEFLARVRPARSFANEGTWDYAGYLARQSIFYRTFSRSGDEVGIRAGEERPLPGLRLRMLERVQAHAPSPGHEQGKALLMALVVGEKYEVASASLDLVRRASLMHVLALSGFNIFFVAGFGAALAYLIGLVRPSVFLAVPRLKLYVLLSAPLVAGYCWLGDFQPSLMRAALMYAFWGGLLLMGRDRVVLDGLLFAVAALLVTSPLMVQDSGLQLSAGAVAGIFLFYPPMHKAMTGWLTNAWARRLLMPSLAILASSLCVHAAILPCLAVTFGQINPHFYLSVLWLPVAGWISLPLGLAGTVLASIPGLEHLAWPLLDLGALTMQRMLDSLSWLDRAGALWEVVPLRPAWPECLGYWTILLAVVARRRLRTMAPAIAGLCLLLLPPLVDGLDEARDVVRLTALDVGQGQALLVTAPGGRRTLIDGGGFAFGGFDIGEGVLAHALTWRRPPRLDRMILSHPDADHLLGLIYPLRTFKVGEFDFCGQWPGSADYRASLEQALKEAGIAPRVVVAGQRLDLGHGLSLEAVHPATGFEARKNDESLVLRLVWRGRALALLPGDLEKKGIKNMLASGAELGAQVLVLPHHGSKSSLSPELYDRVGPGLALASAGYLNQWAMPNKDVVEDLDRRGCPLLVTGRDGAVTVQWDRPDATPRVWTARGRSLPGPEMPQ